MADGVDFYIQTYNYPYYQASYVQLTRSAANDVYYSLYHDYYWGDSVSPYGVQYGTYLNAANSVGVRLVLQSGGTAFGGTIGIPVCSYSWDYPFDYEDPSSGYYDRGFDRGNSTYGANSGYVTP